MFNFLKKKKECVEEPVEEKRIMAIDPAIKEPKLTAQDYCRISKEAKEKAYDIIRIDFEQRVNVGMFCVGDNVILKPEIDAQVRTSIIKTKYNHSGSHIFYHHHYKIEEFIEIGGIKYIFVEHSSKSESERYSYTNTENHIMIPVSFLTAKWEDNKPKEC